MVEYVTCKQAIAAVLKPGSDDLAYAIYMQVRKKWRKLCESEASSGSPFSTHNMLERDKGIAMMRKMVVWAMEEITRLQRSQLEFMQTLDSRYANTRYASSTITEVSLMGDATVSDTESET